MIIFVGLGLNDLYIPAGPNTGNHGLDPQEVILDLGGDLGGIPTKK